jgi:GNAT superfamily N-acetyltransferase
MEPKIADVNDISKLVNVIKELRPKLTDKEIKLRLPKMFNEGYQICFIGDEAVAYSFAGFRILNFLYSGKTLYVDDFATLPQYRKQGFAKIVFDKIKSIAIREHCDHFGLDSGFERYDAYRFYLNNEMIVESLHFGRKVNEFKRG